MSRGRRKRKRKKNPVTNKFRRDILKRSPKMAGVLVATEGLGLPKLSERLVELAAPLLEEAADDKSSRLAVTLAVVSWNMSVLPDNKRDEALHELIAGLTPDDLMARAAARKSFEDLIARKNELYPDDKRLIVDWDVSFSAEQMHVQVAAATTGDASPPASEKEALGVT